MDVASSSSSNLRSSFIEMGFDPFVVDKVIDENGENNPDLLLEALCAYSDCSDEIIFGVTEKTLHLIEMGFTENDISTAFEICGSEASPQELAESIFNPDAQKKDAGAF